MKNRNGFISISAAIIGIALFFLSRGPDTDLMKIVALLGALSIIGIIYAILSKQWLWCLAGALLNGFIFAIAFLLLIAYGIAH